MCFRSGVVRKIGMGYNVVLNIHSGTKICCSKLLRGIGLDVQTISNTITIYFRFDFLIPSACALNTICGKIAVMFLRHHLMLQHTSLRGKKCASQSRMERDLQHHQVTCFL